MFVMIISEVLTETPFDTDFPESVHHFHISILVSLVVYCRLFKNIPLTFMWRKDCYLGDVCAIMVVNLEHEIHLVYLIVPL